MIKFFRKIRQKLLSENKFSKYLLYAVGEIVLVVIGILIALQVNNWNQDRQKKGLEKRILLEIQKNLKEDIIEIEDEIQSFQTIIETDSILIKHFQTKELYHDSIGSLIHIAQMSPHFVPLRGGYKLLEAKGIDVIADNYLRMLVTDMYEWNFPYYEVYSTERFDAIASLLHPYWTQHFYIEKYNEFPYKKRVPISYHSLSKDPKFISLLQISLFQAEIMKQKSEALKAKAESVHNNIENYLESSFGRNGIEKIRFTLKGYPSESKVQLAGSFNDWIPIEMEFKNGIWQKEFELRTDDVYFYKFVVDGKWIHDIENPVSQNDGHGGLNSVIILESK